MSHRANGKWVVFCKHKETLTRCPAGIEKLAEKYGADKETVIIAAWLHDIASITDYAMYEEHHIYGASIAKEILNEFHYDNDK